MGYARAVFEEDEHTMMVPAFAEGSFFADRYRLDSLIGSGAMGRVYEAVELHSSRRVALKVLHRERLGEPDTVERFEREAEVLASIGHPCIVEIFTFHRTSDGTPYLAMELLEGLTLKTRLQNGGRFEDPKDFQEILDGLAGALSAAHARGVVHRDLKPDNVFLLATGEPRAKLVDFGLSRMAKADKSITQSGMILGTPRYMAPEQIQDASSAGPAGDLYSMGALIHEALTGQSPYPAQDYGQLLGCVLENRITPLEDVRPELGPALGPVIRKAMARQPGDRYATADDLADAYAAAIGVPSRRAEIAARHQKRAARPRRHSGQSIDVASKSSTLAFDASAARAALADAERQMRPEVSLPQASDRGFAAQDGSTEPMRDAEPSSASSPSFPSTRASFEPEELPPFPSAQASPAPSPAQSTPPPSAPASQAPPPRAAAQPPSPLKGSTMLISDAAIASLPAPPLAHTPPAASFSTRAPATAPKKKRGCGVAIFLVALLVVVVLSALAGFALRAYLRGELVLPGG